ncbi:MAG: galactose mutarotase [Bacteroidales bacterium]|nr:galactose mutarotase [Bacteroidales bacterium]
MLTLENSKGFKVVLSPLGAGIISVFAPDKEGKFADVALGYPSQDNYLNDGPCMGKIPGRIAGRIAKGRFSLNGKEYQLCINNGPNHLHSGPEGYQNRIWNVVSATEKEVVFSLESPEGDCGYPCPLAVEARYSIDEEYNLRLEISAKITGETKESTIVNMTNHAYWNLAGHDSGSIRKHELQLPCSQYLPTDENLIPVGIAPVKGTAVDFLEHHEIGERIDDYDCLAVKYGKGYDGGWIIDAAVNSPLCIQDIDAPQEAWPKLTPGAILTDRASGRSLTVFTNQKAAIVYTGNYLSGCPKNKAGRGYDDNDGVAIECQNYPNAINMPEAPSSVLSPGKLYKNVMVFSFSTI